MALTKLIVLAAVCRLAYTEAVAGHEWSYVGEYGVDHWGQMGYNNCEKHRQSPIALDSDSAIRKRFKPMEFYFFDEIPSAMNLTNNFHSAGAIMTTERIPYIKSGGLPGQYEVIGFHFHWGEDSSKGSEHIINGRQYPLEMHVVCKNVKYDKIKIALNHTDGLAVLGVLFEVSETNNRAIARLEDALSQISEGGDTAEVLEPPRLLELMPWNTNDFYRYDGSLTTPGCHEVVTWTVFIQTVKATEKELNLFRSLKKGVRQPIGHNFRSTQGRYGRDVFLRLPEDWSDEEYELGESGPRSNPGGAAAALSGSLATMLAMLCAAAMAHS